MTRSGHIGLVGLPNAGKSTLLNRLVGSHLAIVSPKAQTTRLPVVGVLTSGDTQYVFHDLPGILQPRYLLQERMRDQLLQALRHVHVILHLQPVGEDPLPLPELDGLPQKRITVRTKADLPDAGEPPEGTLLVSARTGEGIDALLAAVRPHLPDGPFEFDPEEIGTQPLRFFATEYLREAAFELLEDEVPYAVAAEVEEFREHTEPVYIRVTLLVERESQKGIVIGKGGQTLKAIGRHARLRLEALLGGPVYLDCWVKVLPNWRRDRAALTQLGFPEPRATDAPRS